jgi:ATP-dependent RNA helicase DDX49/DBP8
VQVNTTLREVNIELDEKDWDERRNINKRKKLILEGKDPDEVKKEQDRRRKKELKREKKARLKAAALLSSENDKSLKAEKNVGLKQKKKVASPK